MVSLIQSNIAKYFKYSNSLGVPVSDVASRLNATDEKAVSCQHAELNSDPLRGIGGMETCLEFFIKFTTRDLARC